MSNSWFRFKQFTIEQDRSAMKVGTDGVMLGAWADTEGANTALDIGTGTGLIALMIAQRSKALVDAVDIDEGAVSQATSNVARSPWRERIQVRHISFMDFYPDCTKKYDLIITNPPYFSRSLKTPDLYRTLARHDDELPKDELFRGVSSILAPSGKFSIIVPSDSLDEIFSLATGNNLYPARILNVKPVPGKKFHRALLEFSFLKTSPLITEMTIETGIRHQYSHEYRELTNDFYLDEKTQ